MVGSPRLFFFDNLMSNWDHEGQRMQCSRVLWELQRLAWGRNGKPDFKSGVWEWPWGSP